MHLGLKCQLGCAPSTGQFFFSLLLYLFILDMIKPSPFPSVLEMVHRADEISSPHPAKLYWIFITMQRFFTNCISILFFFLHNPHLKILSCSEPVALAIIQGSLSTGPQGSAESRSSLSPFKSRSKCPPRLPLAGWVSSCGWPEDELIPLSHCLAHSSSYRTAPC